MTNRESRGQRFHQRGFALAASLLAVVLIGALVAGVFFATTEETAIGSAFRSRQLALGGAESALESVLAGAVTPAVDSIATGETTILETGNATVHITRLDSLLYWVVAESEFGIDATKSRRRIGIALTIDRDSSGVRQVARIPGQAWVELY